MSKPSAPPWPPYVRVPPFLPVPLRSRCDGWSVARQARFVGLLAQGGSVAAAANLVGMSRMAAYRLRRAEGGEGIAHSWDAVLAIRAGTTHVPQRKVTPNELMAWAIDGPVVVMMRRGRFMRWQRKPCNTALLRCLAQFDLHALPQFCEANA